MILMSEEPEDPIVTFEKNDIVEIEDVGTFVVGHITHNKSGNRTYVRLDRKFLPSLRIHIRHRV